jgi:L-threonylcarbamoyladenylate synthase
VTETIQLDSDSTRKFAAQRIANGEVIAFLTDTLYGLGANPHDAVAVEKVHDLKGSFKGKPILILISEIEVADQFVQHRSENFQLLAHHFWAGELTIIEAAKPSLPSNLCSVNGTIGLRFPKSPDVQRIVKECGGSLTATSANPAGAPPATSALEVAAYFGQRIGLIIDGGNARHNEPSTIVDVSSGGVRLVREGRHQTQANRRGCAALG